MSKRVTIKSIADDLGVSHMTVSRALSDNPNVQSDTRAAIRKRAVELGYVPSAAARAMRGDASSIVGLLIPNITNDFYARFANTFAEACDTRGFQLIIHLTKDDFDAERAAFKRLREIQARAVVSVPTPAPEDQDGFNSSDFDLVQLIRRRETSHHTSAVLVDDFDAIRDSVIHLRERGHSRIAYLGAPEALSSGRARYGAFREGMKAAGLQEDERLIFTEEPSLEMGDRLTRHLITQTDAESVVCAGFEISNGALKAAMELNALNKRLVFVGYGDPDFYSWIEGGLTTVRVPVDELAYCAVNLIAELGGATSPPHESSFKAHLVVRG